MPHNTQTTVQAKSALYDAAAKLIKEIIWRYGIRFRPTKQPICLYASRRSGSSLLMETIAVNRGVLYSDQPFTAYTANAVNLNMLPLFPYGQIAYPDTTEEQLLHNFLRGVLKGEIRANWPWKLFGPEFHRYNDRICLKITDGKLLIDWIAEQFHVHTVVLTRHPISQALSVKQLGWLSTGKGLLRNASYVSRWLNQELFDFCTQIYSTGTELEWRVLDWALENLPLIEQLKARQEWLYVSYEDLIAHSDLVISVLCEQLGLPDRSGMLRRLRSPSRSTRRESTQERKAAIERGDQHQLVDSWRAHVSDDDVSRSFAILDKLDLRLYQPEDSFPNSTWLRRPTIAVR
jgi:hypothetical protein